MRVVITAIRYDSKFHPWARLLRSRGVRVVAASEATLDDLRAASGHVAATELRSRRLDGRAEWNLDGYIRQDVDDV